MDTLVNIILVLYFMVGLGTMWEMTTDNDYRSLHWAGRAIACVIVILIWPMLVAKLVVGAIRRVYRYVDPERQRRDP